MVGGGREKGGKERKRERRKKEGGIRRVVWLNWVGWLGFVRFCWGIWGWSFVSSIKLGSPVGSTMAGRNAVVHPLDIGASVSGLRSKIRLGMGLVEEMMVRGSG